MPKPPTRIKAFIFVKSIKNGELEKKQSIPAYFVLINQKLRFD